MSYDTHYFCEIRNIFASQILVSYLLHTQLSFFLLKKDVNIFESQAPLFAIPPKFFSLEPVR